MSTPTNYPLTWPGGWPKTEPHKRERARFNTTVPKALAFLKDEVRRLGGTGLILSSNYTLGNENPKESGVVAYFQYESNPVAIPCDRWLSIEDNVKAIALTIEAMRGMERWGAKHMIQAMFKGFKALPEFNSRKWWEILQVPSNATEGQIRDAYRTLAKLCHPDAPGGSHDKMIELGEAQKEALKKFPVE